MSEPVHEIGNKVITHTVKGVGTFYLTASQDEQYPGVDIELIPEKNSKFDTGGTNPRILFEVPRPDGQLEDLRALLWTDRNSEDYSIQEFSSKS